MQILQQFGFDKTTPFIQHCDVVSCYPFLRILAENIFYIMRKFIFLWSSLVFYIHTFKYYSFTHHHHLIVYF